MWLISCAPYVLWKSLYNVVVFELNHLSHTTVSSMYYNWNNYR